MQVIKEVEFTIGRRQCRTLVLEDDEGYRFRVRVETHGDTSHVNIDRERAMGKFDLNVATQRYSNTGIDDIIKGVSDVIPGLKARYDIDALKFRRRAAGYHLQQKRDKIAEGKTTYSGKCPSCGAVGEGQFVGDDTVFCMGCGYRYSIKR